MNQIMQDLNHGECLMVTAPAPNVGREDVLIASRCSLISPGTERMLVDFGKASWLSKARQQPEKVKMVLEKVKSDGLAATIDSVRSKLNQPISLGYCQVGIVTAVGAGVEQFLPGDRVVSSGAHADMVCMPKNLCAKIPDTVSDEMAVFTVAASIPLQGIRLANPTLGEAFAVIGAGLMGLLAVQLLRAHGCRVLALDFDAKRLALAKAFGAETCLLADGVDAVAAGMAFSRGRGVDGVLITASTKSNDPITQAAHMSRKRGRIVLVGVSGLNLDRADFYEKELSFQISCSYGPGRYDPQYEARGFDYPLGFVRWTSQRNFEAVLDMMAAGLIDTQSLVTHEIPFEDAAQAYDVLSSDKNALGIVLKYASNVEERKLTSVPLVTACRFNPAEPVMGVIGAGNYASRVLLPAFKDAGVQFHTLVTNGGVSGAIHGKKLGFSVASTDVNAMLDTQDVNTVVIATRHDSHATLVSRALSAGKHVFVEKPLALNLEELSDIEAAWHIASMSGKATQLMVGFNRRFSAHARKMQALLTQIIEPKSFIITVNAGAIPEDHWTQDPLIGGGRLIGEACHFIDLMRFFANSSIVSVHARKIGADKGLAITEDKAAITLGFADGSMGVIHYLANGSSAYPKERVEVFAGGRVLQLDNFRTLHGFGWKGFKKFKTWRQDKGQAACCKAFADAVRSGTPSPIPFNELVEVARVTIEAATQVRGQL
ncbi:zinc-binding dehydrogenase [Legionella geestiana]|uniref:bi-domain-containing oxidoreductase n=1 Tax=Legionella geestiana TaxID=45065 RepID=UPI00109199F7|nr:bi-domain-containing oxidoreductase [Legionella geestiana]QDQ40012.1 zinc-binding dehydrogenase [Legionella geestiana]